MHQAGQLSDTAGLSLSSFSGRIGLPFLPLGVWWGCRGESEAEDEVEREGGWLRENKKWIKLPSKYINFTKKILDVVRAWLAHILHGNQCSFLSSSYLDEFLSR